MNTFNWVGVAVDELGCTLQLEDTTNQIEPWKCFIPYVDCRNASMAFRQHDGGECCLNNYPPFNLTREAAEKACLLLEKMLYFRVTVLAKELLKATTLSPEQAHVSRDSLLSLGDSVRDALGEDPLPKEE